MQMKRSHLPATDRSAGVSENIGAMLMISLVVAAVALVGVFVFSQPTPQTIPNINFMTGTDAKNNLYLYHNGGDTLKQGDFSVLVDGVNTPYSVPGGEWSLGKNVVIPLTGSPKTHNIAIVYNSTGSGSIVLRSASSSNISSLPGTISGDIIPAPTYPPVIITSDLVQNIGNNSVNYYRDGGTVISGGFIQFNITKINSTMFYKPTASSNPVIVQLDVGNVVKITPSVSSTLPPSLRVFGIGDQIWELTSENATLSITNRSGGDFNPGLVPITHTWVTGYKDILSTLVISPSSPLPTNFTELVLNRYSSYDASQRFSSQIINSTSPLAATISNAGPTTTGIFVLQYDSKTKTTYFVGNGTVS
jgi:hypothetical protein